MVTARDNNEGKPNMKMRKLAYMAGRIGRLAFGVLAGLPSHCERPRCRITVERVIVDF